jgi:hypothetical protein
MAVQRGKDNMAAMDARSPPAGAAKKADGRQNQSRSGKRSAEEPMFFAPGNAIIMAAAPRAVQDKPPRIWENAALAMINLVPHQRGAQTQEDAKGNQQEIQGIARRTPEN